MEIEGEKKKIFKWIITASMKKTPTNSLLAEQLGTSKK